jgi:hypothetical protein
MHLISRNSLSGVLLLMVVSLSPSTVAQDEFEILDINEGVLRFLTEPPTQAPHVQSTHVVINKDSLKSGWIGVKQCHHQLAPVSAMQVVFRRGRVRNLQILQADNIGRAWVEGPSVQLTDVEKNAILCILSENRALRRNSLDGSYEWHGGPYMRRFLDGFFPMHVKLAIDYPSSHLKLQSIEPSALKLKAVTQPGHVRMDALFEGRLDVTLRFSASEVNPGIGWQ